ncbi:acyltransferase-domain-containing protein [Auriculariales sp. MPI-PUGE-AT-0066]|nr:acyltransferase-domain-containing protein [Auriculariales sp. MPI-PUGE-AT-0066]
MAEAKAIYATPISDRPPMPWKRWPAALGFVLAFNVGHILVHGMQLFMFVFIIVPLRLVFGVLGLSFGKVVHEELVRWSKASYCLLLLVTTQWFSPTEFTVSMEGDLLKPEDVVVRDTNGRVVSLNLPTKKLVVMSNHQVYNDWSYTWNLLYFCNLHMDIFITLKKSLKWLPVIGWGMQFFRFIFMARSWADDKDTLARELARLGKRSEVSDQPLALIVFPEGTLVSKDTRPISKKFADKMGISDGRYTLLPRSTGMLYALRSLSPRVADLHVLDITIAYPGVPPMGYGQNYYTLRSIGIYGAPPPRVHIHLKLYNVKRDVPIGKIDPNSSDVSEEDRVKFDEWMRERFVKKDEEFERYYATGSLAGVESHEIQGPATVATPLLAKQHTPREVSIPIKLRSPWEVLDAFTVPGPAAWGLLSGSLRLRRVKIGTNL